MTKNKTLVCYVETDNHDGKDKKILYSLNRLNIPIVALGKNEIWGGFIDKLRYVKKGMEDRIGQYDYVLCTDARDVLYYKGLDVIEKEYEKHRQGGARVLFNAETNCYPNKELMSKYPYPNKKYRYLNAGIYMGDFDYVLEILGEAIMRSERDNDEDDQHIFSQMYIEKYNLYGEKTKFRIDTECSLFQCLWDEDFGRSANFDIVYNKDRIYNNLTNTEPCVFHYPGSTCVSNQVWKIINNKYHIKKTWNFK